MGIIAFKNTMNKCLKINKIANLVALFDVLRIKLTKCLEKIN
jgi:hypothetical protein